MHFLPLFNLHRREERPLRKLNTKFSSVFRIISTGLVIQINFKHSLVPKIKQAL